MENITKPVIMVFKKDQDVNFKEVRHYNLIKGEKLLSEKVNISKDRKFSKSKARYWLKIREGNKWSKCLTGLFPTWDGLVYYGDTMSKTNMLWFKFSEKGEKLTIYYFKRFYSNDTHNFLKILHGI